MATDTETLLRTLRTGLLALVAFGCAGLGLELILLEHWEEPTQWPPLLLLTGGFLGAVALLVRPSRAAIRIFRTVMVFALLSGGAGAFYHYRANAALEREVAPDRPAMEIASAALRGGVPTLAPGAMVQLGLLGLLACVGHPGARRRPDSSPSSV
ncbi:MAG: hypothetical protein KJO11_17385 [Gemmatimonadetes bacterium]|nr:hypothetical protein [Gemmatimonadota bacterium]MBT8404754.1 hypothetical protein [Gemmatimonadota bacterium]NNF38200.1 hypothetical protein [Gemmatimonadota bacterium]NNK62414.1 hypothetical protein [Gemmatimonadota bacterium]